MNSSFNNGEWLGRVKFATLQNNNIYSEEANNISNLVAVTLTPTADGKYWFWYVAPDDFTKNGIPQGEGLYDDESERFVNAKFSILYADGTTEILNHKITIVRPPLMLVHVD